MKCTGNYLLARFLERPNRFLAKVILESSNMIEYIHVPDPGRLKELLIPQTQVIIKKSTKATRKTKYSLIGVKIKSSINNEKIWVNIDSLISNRLFEEEFNLIPSFKHFKIIKPEFTFGNSRFDFLMEDVRDTSNKKIITEIKSVTLVKDGLALFPDAPTKRGLKHLKELKKALNFNFKSQIIFLIKRCDVNSFSPNKEIDPTFSEALLAAFQSGVQLFAFKCFFDPIKLKELKIITQLPINLINDCV